MNGRWIQIKMTRSEGLASLLLKGRNHRRPNQGLSGLPAGGSAPAALSAPQPRSLMHPKFKAAFSLVELMVVLGIIGLLATLGLPMIKAHSQSNAIGTANRQLLDDISLARMKAINNRTTVYMVFAPTNLTDFLVDLKRRSNDPRHLKVLTNLIAGQYSAYALVAKRTVGDQPGRPTARYLTEWRTLPEGIFIAPSKFSRTQASVWASQVANITNRPFAYNSTLNQLPFPTASSPLFPPADVSSSLIWKYTLPYIAFNSLGQLDRTDLLQAVPLPDEVIPLTRGSMMFTKDPRGRNTFDPPDFREVPPGNSVSAYNRIHIYWQTGRARVEKPEVR